MPKIKKAKKKNQKRELTIEERTVFLNSVLEKHGFRVNERWANNRTLFRGWYVIRSIKNLGQRVYYFWEDPIFAAIPETRFSSMTVFVNVAGLSQALNELKKKLAEDKICEDFVIFKAHGKIR